MKHRAINEHQGVWLNAEDDIYCRWRWQPDTRMLHVDNGKQQTSWQVPEADQHELAGMQIDLAETAKDVAALLERQARAS